MRIDTVRLLRALTAWALVGMAVGCSSRDATPPVATVSFEPSKPRASLGSPIDVTYRFDMGPGATIAGDYRVFVHFNNVDGQILWNDDHEPSIPTSQWKPGQKIEYTRTRFIPTVPYLGEVSVEVGLYKDNDRLPLLGPAVTDKESETRSYKVGSIQLLSSSNNVFVIYKSGWHPEEFSPEDPTVAWKWTQKSAVLSVRNPRTDVVLYLEYDARPDVFPGQPQKVTVSAGDQVVTAFVADSGGARLLRIPISAAQLGPNEMTDLRFDVDRTFIPASLPAGGRDIRELGVRVYHAFLESR